MAFNFARNPHYQDSYNFAATHNIPGYKPPGYNRLRTTLLKNEKMHIDKLLEHVKSTWIERGVTICADGWSDPCRRPLINFVAISEKAPVFLKAENCEGDLKTKEYIFEKLKSVIEEVGRHNVVQVITDNAPNCRGAGLLVQAEYDNIYWTPCVVHTLNLALKNICEPKKRTLEEIEAFIEFEFIAIVKNEATMIKNFIMNHGMRLSMFNEFSPLKLLAIAETRFASVVIMLRRFVLVKNALQSMVISPQWDIYKDDTEAASVVKEKILSDVWWSKVEYILKITEPLHEMIRVADTDNPCLHLVYEMWDSMIEKVRKAIHEREERNLNDHEESPLFKQVYKVLIDRWTKGK